MSSIRCFSHMTEAVCIFALIVGIEPTVYFLKGNRATITLYQPTVMSYLCCSIIFWTTEYNSPHTFCLADYSVMFRDRCPCIATKPLTTNNALQPLDATPRTITLPFLILADKLVLYRGQHHLFLSAYSSSRQAGL